MDAKEARRIFVAAARREAREAAGLPPEPMYTGSEVERIVAQAIESGVKKGIEAVVAGGADPEPPRRSALEKTAAELEQDYPGSGVEWRNRHPGEPQLSIARVPDSEQRRLEHRGEQIANGAVDLRTASPAQAEARLRQLGVDGVLVGDLGLRPYIPPQPTPEPPKSGISLRDPRTLSEKQRAEMGQTAALREQAGAESELALAEAKAVEAGVALDTRSLSAGAFALYRKRRGLE